MSEHALYRKYRPHTFEEVRGQDQIVQSLQSAIRNDNIGHAYLFVGSRGIGKTTLARIFAREIGTVEHDLVEIDAASNRGIDDIRALREETHVVPFSSRFKVYIIDEVHMLTKDAWNALLKTLEEPPRHVVFILATTEVDKIPETILSRCQIFTLRRPTSVLLTDLILTTAKREGCEIDRAGAELIALLADGAFRDAHGILQKVIASNSEKNITHADVERVTGAPRSAALLEMLDAVATRNLDMALTRLHALVEGGNVKTTLALVLRIVRAALLVRTAPTFATTLQAEFTPEEWVSIERYAQDAKDTLNSRLLTRLLSASLEVGTTYLPALPLELALIEHLAKS
nr:DNA polymerase III subunit gamma/tau [Candidatus Paceibacterota bacterium]